MFDPRKITAEIARELGHNREDKINKIKTRVCTGSYKIKSSKVARALVRVGIPLK